MLEENDEDGGWVDTHHYAGNTVAMVIHHLAVIEVINLTDINTKCNSVECLFSIFAIIFIIGISNICVMV